LTNAERAPKGPFAREAEPKALRRLWLSDLATHSHCSSGEQHEAQRESGADCGVAPVALAALATLSFGAVLGPEAPLIALGSVVGTAVLPFVRVDTRESAVLSTAGSFSAVSALFGGRSWLES
jgi:hypothetical protein